MPSWICEMCEAENDWPNRICETCESETTATAPQAEMGSVEVKSTQSSDFVWDSNV